MWFTQNLKFLWPLLFSIQSLSAEENRFWLLGGFDFGYARANTDIATEYDKNGFQLNLKGVASYEWPRWVLDGGFGWMYQFLTGADLPVVTEEITTRALFAEIAGRYRITDRWQTGLLTRSVFGTDLEFGSGLNKTNFGQFAGIQGAYEMPISKFLLRFTAQALTDLNIENRQLYLLEAGVQFGFSPLSFTPEESPPPPSRSTSIQLDLEGGTFYFDFASSALKDDAKKYLEKVGAYLGKHLDSWKELQIDGHTDERGSEEYNMELSRARAKEVESALVSGGAPKERLATAGYSFHRPRKTGRGEKIWKENRRVELKFSGVAEPSVLTRELHQLKP